MRAHGPVLLLCGLCLGGCGGKAVVDDGSSSGEASSGSSGSSERPACGPQTCTGDANVCTCQAECGIRIESSETELYLVHCSRSTTADDWGCTCTAGGDLVAPCNGTTNPCDVQSGCCANAFWD